MPNCGGSRVSWKVGENKVRDPQIRSEEFDISTPQTQRPSRNQFNFLGSQWKIRPTLLIRPMSKTPAAKWWPP